MSVVEVRGVTKAYGHVVAVNNVSFAVYHGQIVSLLGPTGCGKTTTLRLIAGFENPDEGSVYLAGKDVRGKRPYERNVGLLFQDYALFPHMSVEQNVSYGMRYRGVDRRSISRLTAEMLELVRLNGYENRRPDELSGGQQQRVALARALATNPEVILLDEPLSALDAKLRQELRLELKEILAKVGTTGIIVTHDQQEAMSLASHLIVMDQGKVMQQGSPTEIYAAPRTKFVAEFIGRSNWFKGRIREQLESGVAAFETSDGIVLRVAYRPHALTTEAEVGIRPERIRVRREEANSTAGALVNCLQGIVADAATLGADVHLFVTLDCGRRLAVIEKNLGQPMDAPGRRVTLAFAPEDCIIVPPGDS